MDPIYTVIIAILAVLAVSGLFVGVTNDAVNFLNSAIGSKAAPRRVILIVASIGILVGTLTSSGMMEVARNGVFYPGQFSFPEIMMLFLGMMLGNVLLLDLYNTLGLPTSTTVSLIFCLLGAAIAVSVYKIAGDPAQGVSSLGQYINTSRAMGIVSAILLSVVIALMGVFGIVLFETQHRRREVAIRKVMGATTAEVLRLFNRRYVVLVTVCFILAAPVGFWIVDRWLASFAYRTPIHWWVFAAAFAAVLLVTIGTVTFCSWRTADENPAASVKSE